MIYKSKINKYIVTILFFGLIFRLLFSFWLSKFYFGELKFHDSDTWSFLNSFRNLIDYGIYSFDLENRDAYIYRGPVYSFFLGFHYIIFGEENVFKYVAFTQCILDTSSGYLIYRIIKEIKLPDIYGYIGAVIYLINPIFISYAPIAYAETISTTIALLIFLCTIKANNKISYLILGGLCAVGVMTRQHLGMLLPAACLMIAFKEEQYLSLKLKNIGFIIIGFTITVSPWFIRNAVNIGTPTILMGKTTGYPEYQEDFIAVDKFYNLYFVDVTPIMRSISITGDDGLANKKIFGNLIDEISKANMLAYECGPSFIIRRIHILGREDLTNSTTQECKKEIVDTFTSLRKKAINENGLDFYLKVPLMNIKKSILKSELTKPIENKAKEFAINMIFLYRSTFIITGLISIIFLHKNQYIYMITFPIGMILYTSTVMRHVEIRYHAQAEAFLIVYAILFIHQAIKPKGFNGKYV